MHFPERKGFSLFGVVLDGKSHQHQGNRHNGKTEKRISDAQQGQQAAQRHGHDGKADAAPEPHAAVIETLAVGCLYHPAVHKRAGGRAEKTGKGDDQIGKEHGPQPVSRDHGDQRDNQGADQGGEQKDLFDGPQLVAERAPKRHGENTDGGVQGADHAHFGGVHPDILQVDRGKGIGGSGKPIHEFQARILEILFPQTEAHVFCPDGNPPEHVK